MSHHKKDEKGKQTGPHNPAFNPDRSHPPKPTKPDDDEEQSLEEDAATDDGPGPGGAPPPPPHS
jgi:hypothetical protein